MAPPMPGLHGSTFTLRQSLHITVMCVALCCAQPATLSSFNNAEICEGESAHHETQRHHDQVRRTATRHASNSVMLIAQCLQPRCLSTCFAQTGHATSSAIVRQDGSGLVFIGRAACRGRELRALGLEAAVTMPGTMTSRETLSDCERSNSR